MEDESVVEEGSLSHSLISRRNLIKAGAIVGGVVWAAPVIDSFTSPASATSYTSGCYVCYYTNDSGTLVPFHVDSDDPTIANGEAPYNCKKSASDSGLVATSGVFVLYNSNTNTWVTTSSPFECYFGSPDGGLAGLPPVISGSPQTLSCPSPGSLPPSVVCFTGTWG